MIDLNDYIAGGYRLNRSIYRPEYFKDGLLPEKLFSAGQCIGGSPGILDWAGGKPEALGVAEKLKSHLNDWGRTAFGQLLGYPDVFYTLSAAQAFVADFIPSPPDNLMILCPALHHQYINEFVKTQKNSPSEGERGVYEMIVCAQHPSMEGSVLGYEPLCYDYGLDHTWYCNDLHVHAFERWRIKPNAHGFLDSFEDAKKIAEMALSIGAEDGWWLPWLIIKYEPKA